jgi:hypothetical protein
MPVSDALPYGVRDIKLTQYTDAVGTTLNTTSVDLPYIQTLNFTEAEEFQELRGDDRLVTTRGRGSQVNWSLESGGLPVYAWAVLTGGSVTEVGLTPNRVNELKKKATASRPFFRIDGRIISDSGGDILVRIYRCRATGDIQANFQNGEFATSQISGVGLPLLDETNDLVYSIFRRETATALTLTPDVNPLQSPLNLAAGTISGVSPSRTVVLTWTAVSGATSYFVEKSTDGGTTWASAGTNPTAATLTPTGLSTGTVQFRVSTNSGAVQSDPCLPISVVV